MWKNYLVTALRALARNKLTAAINIGGLAVGLAACLMIALMIRYETGYEDWIPDAERIYQIRGSYKQESGEWFDSASVQVPLKPALEDDYGKFAAVARVRDTSDVVRRDGEIFRQEVREIDPTFLEIIPLEFLRGGPLLPDFSTVLLSESAAERYFGGLDVIGRTLEMDGEAMRIGGVFANLPEQTHFEFTALRRFDETASPYFEWNSTNVHIYAKAGPDADLSDFPAAQAAIVEKYLGDYAPPDTKITDIVRYIAMPLSELHLHATPRDSAAPRIQRLYTFGGVALLIVAIAAFNFINLMTARAILRAREIGLRKVMGADRRDLVLQFLGEALLTVLLALALAVALAEAVLPWASQVLQVPLSMAAIADPTVAAALLVLTLALAGLSGAYPAFHLSAVQPVESLRDAGTRTARTGILRNGLVILQYAAAIALGIVALVIALQIEYARDRDLGFEERGLIGLRWVGQDETQGFKERLERDVLRLEGVEDVTWAFNLPTDTWRSTRTPTLIGRETPPDVGLEINPVDFDFFSVFKAAFLAGRPLEERLATDTLRTPDGVSVGPATSEDPYVPASAVLNATAMPHLGFDSPEEAIGARLRMGLGYGQGNAEFTIVGVVKDIHYFSARDEVIPTIYYRQEAALRHMAVRFAPGMAEQVHAAIERVWRELVPEKPLATVFVADSYDRLYARDEQQMTMLAGFAGLAIATASLGLYGLAAFMTARRTREIAVRKVMGARIRQILPMLAWQFARLVAIAAVLAAPVGYVIAAGWLEQFAFRIDLTPWPFLLAGATALAIALLTVAGHALRVARTHPALALREE